MAAMSKKYRLYHLLLFAEVVIEEMNEVMRYGVSPLGVGYMEPLKKDVQVKIRSTLIKIEECVNDAAEKMIKNDVAAPDGSLTSEEWLRMMLEELRTRVHAIETPYAQELKPITGLIQEMNDILAGNERADDEK